MTWPELHQSHLIQSLYEPPSVNTKDAFATLMGWKYRAISFQHQMYWRLGDLNNLTRKHTGWRHDEIFGTVSPWDTHKDN